MMILEEGQVCPYKDHCPYNNNSSMTGPCYGAVSTRKGSFTCEFVVNGKILKDAGTRLPGDQTGKMKVILE